LKSLLNIVEDHLTGGG